MPHRERARAVRLQLPLHFLMAEPSQKPEAREPADTGQPGRPPAAQSRRRREEEQGEGQHKHPTQCLTHDMDSTNTKSSPLGRKPYRDSKQREPTRAGTAGLGLESEQEP